MRRFQLTAVAISLLVVSCGGEVAPTTTVIAAGTTTTQAAITTVPPTTTVATTTTAPPTTTVAPTTTTTTATTTTTTTTVPPTTTVAPTTTTTTTVPATTTTEAIDYVAMGADLAANLGCQNCHSTNGSAGLGPSWAGLAGSTVTLSDGAAVTATNGYIESSIRSPDSQIVDGYSAGVMQNDYTNLTAAEIRALVAYIASR